VSHEKSQTVGVRVVKTRKIDWSRIAHENCQMFYEISR